MESKNKKDNPQKKKNFSFKFKFIITVVNILLCMGLFVAGYFGMRKFLEVKTENKVALVSKQLSFCQELVTLKYRYSDIVTLKKTAGFSKSYSIIKYTGLIRAGLGDFTDLTNHIEVSGKKVKIKMPNAELLGNEIISMEVFDEKQSIFVPITTQEIFDEIEAARRTTVEDLVDEGLLTEAREYAIKIITQNMEALGFETVVIE